MVVSEYRANHTLDKYIPFREKKTYRSRDIVKFRGYARKKIKNIDRNIGINSLPRRKRNFWFGYNIMREILVTLFLFFIDNVKKSIRF